MQWGQQQQAQAAWGQQQQQAPANAWAQAAAKPANPMDVTLVVTGCTHATVGAIVRGSFQLLGENHGRPTYKKDGQVNGLDVMTYYWDERDGPGFCGWWFGPKVGGDQVWAYHTDKAAQMPPQTGWKVPYDGPVDPSLVIAYKPKGGAAPAAAQPQQQAWGQQAQQAQQGAGAWGAAQQQQLLQQQQLQQQQMQAKQLEAQRLNAQRTQLEQLKQKQMQDGQANAAAMRQQQMQQQQARMEENKTRLEAANQSRMAEQKKKMDDMKAAQAELIKKRAEEQKRKEEELQAKKQEQIAVLNVRREMQKFRASLPDKYDEAKAALDEVCAKEVMSLGSQKDRIVQEVEAAVTATKERIDKVNEMKNKKIEQVKAAQALIGQLEKMVVKAEAGATGVSEEAEPLYGDKEMKVSQIDACATAVEEASKEVGEKVKSCLEFVTKETIAIKSIPVIQGEAAPTCAADLGKLVARINAAKTNTAAAVSKCNQAKLTRTRKAHAKAKYEQTFVSFKKYDADKDGKLSRRELQAFSKGEYGFALPIDSLDNICSTLIAESAKGVEKADFHRAKIMIGVAREAAIDSKRRADKEAREKMLEALKEKLQGSIKSTGELVTEATEAVQKAEKAAAPLNASKANQTSSEMVALASETSDIVEAAKTCIKTAKDAIEAMSAKAADEPELKAFVTVESQKLKNLLSPLEGRCTKAGSIATQFHTAATKKNTAELEKIKADALKLIFFHQGAKKLLSLGLYDAFDKKKQGKVAESAFVAFFKTCAMKEEDDERLSEDDASRLFAYLDTDDKGSVSKDQFMNLIRRFMKVLKASVLTEETSTKSKPMRRLNEGEVLECLSGPTEAEGEDIFRLKVKATSDSVEGWVTPVGNRGTVFVEDGGNVFKVVKETILTGSFVIGADTKTKDRKLKVGEVCEVREWPTKEENSGLMRMKVALKSDGQLGWVTSVGNTGIKFLEVM